MTIAGVNISDTHCERAQREETNHTMIAIEIVSTEVSSIAPFTLALQSSPKAILNWFWAAV